MRLPDRRAEKMQDARAILERCIGKKGVWADPTRYRFQCWTRDLVLAVMPLLLELGRTDIIRTHLDNLSKRQRPNGQIPILFLDRVLPFLFDKIFKSLRDGKVSFMLRRFLAGQLWNLTPGTKDSEILYLLGMHEYASRTGDRSLLVKHAKRIEKALAYIENNLMRDGLVVGCDWRDTMHDVLGDRTLLTNNCLLYRAYELMGLTAQAERLRARINERLWNGRSYLDYPGSTRFDPLGGALAILYGVAPRERRPSLAASFRAVNSLYGVTIKCKHNPISREEREIIERTDGVVVWPFVVGFVTLALLMIGERDMAEDQFQRLLAPEGFREWLDPATGKGCGAGEQLWSATLLWRVILEFAKAA